jgi:hypothetical protein
MQPNSADETANFSAFNAVQVRHNQFDRSKSPSSSTDGGDAETTKSEESNSNSKRKLEDYLRSNPHFARNMDTVERRGEEWEPETYYSEVLGCEFTFPLSKFLANHKHCNPAFRNAYRRFPYSRRDEKPPAPKAFKFDPPTFKYGDEPEEEKPKEEENPAKKEEEDDDYDAFVIPSHVPGVMWSRREIDMLVESSKRWMRDLKEDCKKEQEKKDGAEKKDVVEVLPVASTAVKLGSNKELWPVTASTSPLLTSEDFLTLTASVLKEEENFKATKRISDA